MLDEPLEQALRELVDRQAITDCLNRYARGLDRKDLDMLRSAYHDDAVDHHGAMGDYSPDSLIEDWLIRDGERVFSQHLLVNTSIDLDGDQAHAETYFQLVIEIGADVRPGDPRLSVTGGRYVDRFERRSGQWRIARRAVVVEYKAALDSMPDHPGRLMWSRRSKDDPSYARPLLGPPAA